MTRDVCASPKTPVESTQIAAAHKSAGHHRLSHVINGFEGGWIPSDASAGLFIGKIRQDAGCTEGLRRFAIIPNDS